MTVLSVDRLTVTDQGAVLVLSDGSTLGNARPVALRAAGADSPVYTVTVEIEMGSDGWGLPVFEVAGDIAEARA